MTGTILAAVDDSNATSAVLERAVSLAVATGDDLVVLTVVEPRGSPLAFGIEEVDDLNTAATTLAEHVSEAYGDRALEIDAAVRRGRPHDEILAAAEEADASTLVVGRGDSSGLPEALLGSTADRVTRLSPVPVVVVPIPETGPGSDE